MWIALLCWRLASGRCEPRATTCLGSAGHRYLRFLVLQDVFVSIDLRPSHDFEIFAVPEGLVPLDDPAEAVPQGKDRMPVQEPLRFRRIQLEQLSLVEARFLVTGPNCAVPPRQRQLFGDPRHRLRVFVGGTEIPARRESRRVLGNPLAYQ